jgi:hypothetical protein
VKILLIQPDPELGKAWRLRLQSNSIHLSGGAIPEHILFGLRIVLSWRVCLRVKSEFVDLLYRRR